VVYWFFRMFVPMIWIFEFLWSQISEFIQLKLNSCLLMFHIMLMHKEEIIFINLELLILLIFSEEFPVFLLPVNKTIIDSRFVWINVRSKFVMGIRNRSRLRMWTRSGIRSGLRGFVTMRFMLGYEYHHH